MIKFNFKKEAEKPKEMYEFPVLTQLPYSGEKNSVVKFKLNQAAIYELGYNPENLKSDLISIGMVDDKLVLVNTTGQSTDHQFNVNMDGTVNSKFLLGRLIKLFAINPEESHEFKLTIKKDDDSELTYGEVEVLTMKNVAVEAKEPTLFDDEIFG